MAQEIKKDDIFSSREFNTMLIEAQLDLIQKYFGDKLINMTIDSNHVVNGTIGVDQTHFEVRFTLLNK